MTGCKQCGDPRKHPFRALCSRCTLVHYQRQLDAALRQGWAR